MNSTSHQAPSARKTSLAAVFRGPKHPLQIEAFALPDLAASEVLIEVSCCTICGSDLHTIRGDRPVGGPTVLGHEMIGHVAALSGQGPPVCDVASVPLQVGDRVTWAVAASCGGCFFCGQGLPQKCERLFKYGHETTNRSALSGGLAQYCHLVPGTAVVKVPESLSDYVACPANCATATVAAATRVAGSCANKSVLIHGAGMLGLTTAAMAATQGATTVTVTDLSQQRLEMAKAFGATHTVQINDDVAALSAMTGRLTGDRGVDLAFEMSGAADAIELSVDLLRTGGQLVLVGSVFPTRAVQLSPEQIVRKLLRIDGVHNYTPGDLGAAIEFLDTVSSRYPFESLVNAEFKLRDLDAVIDDILGADHIRVAIRGSDE